MKIKDVERFTIPIERAFGAERMESTPPVGTTVEELIKALKRLPPKGLVNADFNSGDIVVMHYKPDIDSVCPYVEAMDRAVAEMAAWSYMPSVFLR